MKKINILTAFFLYLFMELLFLVCPLLSQERFRKIPPHPKPLAPLKLPDIQSTSLSNDLHISLINQDKLPIISLKVIIFSGESSSSQRLPSLATLTARTLSNGASFLSADEIEERIEVIGGTFSVSTYPDYSLLSFTFLNDYFDQALDLLSGMLLLPTFPEQEIENEKRTLYYELVERIKDPEFLVRRQLLRLLFRNHHYNQINYNLDVIRNSAQEDLVSFHDNYYLPNNAHIILAGNLDIENALRRIMYYFARWKRKELKHSSSPSPQPFAEKKVCFIDLPEAEEATIYMGNIMPAASHPDIFPLIVMNQILGGTTNDRLFMNLRESKGYAYHVFSELEFYEECSVFLVKARVRPDVVYASIEEIYKEINNISAKKIPSVEVEQAKSYIIGNFPLHIQTLESLTSKIAEIKALNLGEEHWSKYNENIMAVNPETVFEMARKYPLLTPVVVIAGNSDIIIDQFRGKEEVEVFDQRGTSLGRINMK